MNKAFVVTRHIALAQPLNHEAIQQLVALKETLSFSTDGPKLVLIYDVREMTLSTLFASVALPISTSRWQSLRMWLYHVSDKNLADGAKHSPHCCNKISTH